MTGIYKKRLTPIQLQPCFQIVASPTPIFLNGRFLIMKYFNLNRETVLLLLSGAAHCSARSVLRDWAGADCAPIHLLVARGSTEPPGYGQLNSLATKIIQNNPGATKEAIDYPAKLQPYPPSVSAGVIAVKKQLSSYVEKCPDSKIVLLGYSQGANIIGDALCGGNTGGSGPDTPPLDSSISRHGTSSRGAVALNSPVVLMLT